MNRGVTLSTLRKAAPDWTWRAERHGMGYRYIGARMSRVVEVCAIAVLVDEDRFDTEWRVFESANHSESFSMWAMRNDAAMGEVGRG